MTNEQAIEILQGAIKKPNTKDGYLGQAIDMAIKALEQELCEDCKHSVPEDNFYKAIKDKEYRLFRIHDNKYVTKINDSEYMERKEWDSLVDAKSYIMKKMKENENKGWRE